MLDDSDGALPADDHRAKLQTTTASAADALLMQPTPSIANESRAPATAWINPELLDRAERVCGGYVVPAVCMFGIACNALNLLVLTRRQMRGSPYTYLLGLAVTDVSVLTLSVFESALSKPFGEGVFFWQVCLDRFDLSGRGNVPPGGMHDARRN
jgi:hypothetical protein